jgi:hypothetical protein
MKDDDKSIKQHEHEIDQNELEDSKSSIEQEIDAAFDAVEAFDEEIIALTDIVPANEIDAGTLDEGFLQVDDNDDDDGIIELADVVQPDRSEADLSADIDRAPDDDNDQILELTDLAPAVDVPESDLPRDLDQDEAIIELADVVRPDRSEAQTADLQMPEQPGDALVELGDRVRADDLQGITEDESMAGDESDAADEVIDLADMLDTPEPPAEGLESGDHEHRESIIRLDDILGRKPATAEIETQFSPEYIRDERLDDSASDDAFSTLGIELDELEAEGVPVVSAQEVEAAVERIILKKYGTTIETLIANAVEKAVTREINTIKRSLMDEDDPTG